MSATEHTHQHEETPRSRTSIAYRLRWSYLISSTLPLLIVGALLLWINARAQERSVHNDQKNLSMTIARGVSNYMSDMRQQLRTYMLIIRPGITSPSTWEAEALSLQVRNYPKIVDITVVNTTGDELVRVRNQQKVSSDELSNISAQANIQRALSGQSTYSDIQLNQDFTRVFTITLPLPNDAGAIIGAVQAEIRVDTIAQEMRAATVNSGSHAYLVDSAAGQVLLDESSHRATEEHNIRPLLESGTGTAEYASSNNEQVIGAITPITLAPDDERTGWSIVVERASSVAFASVRSSIPVLVMLIVLVGALALLWAFRQTREILRPLAVLRESALAIGEGHLEHRIPHPGDDEFGDLARTFNHMADHLQRSLAEIEHQNEHLRHGLVLARDIQVGLLPDRAPWPGDVIDVHARSIPAYEVGGDFYSYLALPEGRAAIAIGDISGKGVGAALLMALTASTLESQAHQIDHPAAMLTTLNHLLAPRLKANRMNAALLLAVLDPQRRALRISNAGMVAPVIISPAGVRFLDIGGLPVGAFPGAIYQELDIVLQSGDTLLLISDGVVEAHNAAGELFGFERLEALIAEIHPHHNLRGMVEIILANVQAFMAATEQHDDITIVAIRPTLAAELETHPHQEEQTSTYAVV